MNPDEREMRSGSDHFENTGLMSMEVKVSLFPQQKSQDERACLYLQGWCWISAPKAKKNYLLTCYDRNDTMASKPRIGMVLLY